MTEKEKRQRSGDRREQILTVALGLFAQHGMANVTTRLIARSVGISQPSLYAHFASAQQIGIELCIRAFDTLSARMQDVLDQPGTPREKLYRLGEAYIRFGLQHPDMYRIAFMVEKPHDSDRPDFTDDPVAEAGCRAFFMMQEVVAQIRDVAFDEAVLDAQSIWACVHGLTSLLIARPEFPWAEQDGLIRHHLSLLKEFGR